MATSKITRKTLASGGTEPKKANKTSSFTSGMKDANKSLVKSARTANKLVKSAAKAGVSTVAKGAAKALTASGAVKLANKAVSGALKGAAASGAKKMLKAKTPLKVGGAAPSPSAKISSKISRKYY